MRAGGAGGAGEGNRKLECPLPLSHAQSLEGSTTWYSQNFQR